MFEEILWAERKERRMNIRDIAKLAGVSASTVSKVMNGKDKDISEETKQKVLQIIDRENYVPYFRFLEKEGIKNRFIGLVIQRKNRERDNIVLTAEKVARENGYGIVVNYANSEDEVELLAKELLQKRVSGLLLDSSKRITIGQSDRQIVYINETKEFDEQEKMVLYYRLSEASKMAANQLIRAGHQEIGCIFLEGDASIVHGYTNALRNAGIKEKPIWIYEGRSLEEIIQYGVSQVLSGNVTGVVCGSPEIACCVYQVMERSRTKIPEDLSIISIGDHSILSFLGCGITAICLPSEMMAKTAIDYLLEMIREEKMIEIVKCLQPTVQMRGSVAEPLQGKKGKAILVVGSMNMDVTIEGKKIPVAGETQNARKISVHSGGKGANQAVGVGKLGGQAYMIGCLGKDMDGKQIYSDLMENRVHMDGVLFDTTLPSGKAYINVDEHGESSIVIYQGANQNLNANQIKRCSYLFERADYCLLSLEIPEEVVEYTLKMCKRHHVEVILKPSLTEALTEEMLSAISYFVPNEKELHAIVPGKKCLEEKAKILLERGIQNVIITLGKRGCYLKNHQHAVYFQGAGFEAVDTTGGADSFISAMAVYLSEGKDLLHAIEFAIYASGLSVTRYGVQPALPDRKTVDIYEEEIYLKCEEKRRENIKQ